MPECAELRAQKKEMLKDRLEVIALSLVDAIPDAIAGANLQQITTSLGIVIDKMILLKGQPTEITPVSNMTDEERARRFSELVQKAMAANPEIRSFPFRNITPQGLPAATVEANPNIRRLTPPLDEPQ